MNIPVIDIFAGPGGLGEGFSSLFNGNRERIFKTVLSIEMEKYAHETLTFRSFYRQFHPDKVPEEYYQVLRGELSKDELFGMEKFHEEVASAKKEAKQAKLGFDENSVDPNLVDVWITEALKEEEDWILLGGPPCQAYSIVGRSRNQRTVLNADEDDRVDLYKQYLRIIEAHRPAVFVMENVKGLLSARSKSNSIFDKILADLKEPGYSIYSLVNEPRNNLFDEPEFEPQDFVIRCEEYGIPQTRHRVILLGIREDFFQGQPGIMEKKTSVPLKAVIGDLPRLRSGLSRQKNIWENWGKKVEEITLNGVMKSMDSEVARLVKTTVKNLTNPHKNSGSDFVENRADYTPLEYEQDWFYDKRIGGVCNHESRGHMGSDLHRYLFATSFAKVKGRSPKIEDFPEKLLPDHKNVQEAIKNKKFADRFRVQLENKPSKTITSHISKDGHYYIHPDPSQCRSLTVREAARIQTFPDNYFFCGPRTSQYVQVGNAVPPLLARKIANIVSDLF
jgi:DNA (cytosine-5)-methyltransferase 1